VNIKVETKLWKMAADKPNIAMLEEAAYFLRQGETIAFPTETVYGLGANALNPEAVKKIYYAKGRPSDNPLIVHVCDEKQVENLVSCVSAQARQLIKKFWPGPLTLVMPKSNIVPSIITAGLDTVALRMPFHPVALKLIEKARLPIAAPSANTSGKPSPTTAQHVLEDLNGKIAGIIDAGKAGVGVESTVLDLSTSIPTILRPGGVTREELIAEIGFVNLDAALKDLEVKPRSPGMKYIHYSPEADVIIVKGTTEKIAEKMKKVISEENADKKKIGLMISQDIYKIIFNDLSKNISVQILGERDNLAQITANLFDMLRKFDQLKVEVIYAESFSETGIGAALMNRLYKAAGGKTI